MRIALIAPTAISLPVSGYSGLEREVEYLAEALYKKGHEVRLYCNVGKNVDIIKHPWMENAQHLVNENDPLTYMGELKEFDVVHDWTHNKALRMANMKKYLTTVMWTDKLGWKNVFPSRAVAEAFGKPDGAVVPLGLPTGTYPTVEDNANRYYLTLSRITQYKGVDLAMDVAKKFGFKLTVAGHTGAFAEEFYPMVIRKKCNDAGYVFVSDPRDGDVMGLIRSAKGLIHLHRWIESFSLVMAQALCLGVPVLTSGRGGPAEYVTQLQGGAVTPIPDDGEKGKDFPGEAVQEFLRKEWTLHERQALSERARKLFDINTIADTYLDIYGGL